MLQTESLRSTTDDLGSAAHSMEPRHSLSPSVCQTLTSAPGQGDALQVFARCGPSLCCCACADRAAQGWPRGPWRRSRHAAWTARVGRTNAALRSLTFCPETGDGMMDGVTAIIQQASFCNTINNSSPFADLHSRRDNRFVCVGERLWFSAECLRQSPNKPSTLGAHVQNERSLLLNPSLRTARQTCPRRRPSSRRLCRLGWRGRPHRPTARRSQVSAPLLASLLCPSKPACSHEAGMKTAVTPKGTRPPDTQGAARASAWRSASSSAAEHPG